MTREDLINQRATTCRHGGHCEWVACDKCNHYEPDSLNQQPCDDCISRQEAINCVTSNEFRYKIVEDIKALPSVTPKEKTGRWMGTVCSACGESYPYEYDAKYCPNYGARMVEPQESKKVNCKSTKCENCINHNYCDFEPQESEVSNG